VSFLSRIIAGTKKKDTNDNASEIISETYSDPRPEGMEAQVFSQPVNNIGYEPRHAQPPAYIRIRARYKKDRDFDRVFLAQELQAPKKQDRNDDAKSIKSFRSRAGASDTPDTIWAMQWSRDGRYLAVAGHDKVVRVWAVLASPEDRRKDTVNDDDPEHPHDGHMRLSAPVFHSEPVREFDGHTATVLDLTWSKVCNACRARGFVTATWLTGGYRTISCSRLPWTRLFVYGMSVDRNVSAPLSTTTL